MPVMIARSTTPPMTPPAIAPVWEGDGAGVGVAVEEEELDEEPVPRVKSGRERRCMSETHCS